MTAAIPTSNRRKPLASPDHLALVEKLLAALAVLATAVQRISFGPGVMLRHAVVLVLLPVLAVAVGRFRGARTFVAAGLIAMAAGVLLAQFGKVDHPYAVSEAISVTLRMLSLVGGVCILLWARSVLSLRAVIIAFGVGMLVDGMMDSSALAEANLLKYGLSVPITVLVLGALLNRGLPVQVTALLALAVMAVASDARSMFAICVLSALVVTWQLRPRLHTRHHSWVLTSLMFAAIGVAVYYVGTTLLVEGYLGEDAQARTVGQIDAAGSVLLGGRPELAATLALMQFRPWGFGAGIGVDSNALTAAKTGMASINYDPNNGYVENYLFQRTFIELHSVAGDAWASQGIAGLAVALLVLFFVIRGMSIALAQRTASALLIFLAASTVWNTFFSPFSASLSTMILTLTLVLTPKPTDSSAIP